MSNNNNISMEQAREFQKTKREIKTCFCFKGKRIARGCEVELEFEVNGKSTFYFFDNATDYDGISMDLIRLPTQDTSFKHSDQIVYTVSRNIDKTET